MTERTSLKDPHLLRKSLCRKTHPEAWSRTPSSLLLLPLRLAAPAGRRTRCQAALRDLPVCVADAAAAAASAAAAAAATGLTAEGTRWKTIGPGLGCRGLVCWCLGVLRKWRTWACSRGLLLLSENQHFGFSGLKMNRLFSCFSTVSLTRNNGL